MFGHEIQDHVGGDWRNRVKPRFAELALFREQNPELVVRLPEILFEADGAPQQILDGWWFGA